MALIKKSNQLSIPRNIKGLIYGQAGMGKTTLALSSPKPLLLDFDNGVKRVNNAHLGEDVGIVQVNNWAEVLQLINTEREAINDYDTIVVDTVGKMMDFIISYRCGNRSPKIQDWSNINNDFKMFCATLSSMNKNILFVAHRDTRKEGDDTVFIPALREKNFAAIVTELDILGYLEMRSENGVQIRTITFDPTNRSEGKNTCQLPSIMSVPNILDANGQPTGKNDFIEKNIINRYLNMIAIKEDAIKSYNAILDEIKDSVEQITDARGANHFISNITTYKEHGNSVMMFARDIFSKKMSELKLKYNNTTKQYE